MHVAPLHCTSLCFVALSFSARSHGEGVRYVSFKCAPFGMMLLSWPLCSGLGIGSGSLCGGGVVGGGGWCAPPAPGLETNALPTSLSAVGCWLLAVGLLFAPCN